MDYFCPCKFIAYFCIAFENKGRLAQLVQSVCLTSRGSAVRIRQRPQNQEDSSGLLVSLLFLISIYQYN